MGHLPCLIPPLTESTISSIPKDTPEGVTAIELIDRLILDVKEAQDNLLAMKVAQAEFANRHRGDETEFKIGDKVLLSTDHRHQEYMQSKSGQSTKFMPYFDGPYHATQVNPSRRGWGPEEDRWLSGADLAEAEALDIWLGSGDRGEGVNSLGKGRV